MNTWQELRQSARAAWRQRPPRERRLLALGAAMLLLAALWSIVVGPAWRLWREAPQRQAELEAQTRQMLQLQAEARTLQTPRRVERAEALHLLNASATNLLGPGAQLTPQGETLRVSLKAAPAAGLARWLGQAREQALARPQQAQLEREDGNAVDPNWSGTLVLRLP